MPADKARKNSSLYLFLFGDIDDNYAKKLHQQLESLYSENFDEIVFNFSNVTIFTKASVNNFLEFYRNASGIGKRIRIDGVNDYVAELFASLKLDIPFAV